MCRRTDGRAHAKNRRGRRRLRLTRPAVTERSVTHAAFVVERSYDASPAAKARWFAGPEAWALGAELRREPAGSR
jgi:hypothetical protein